MINRANLDEIKRRLFTNKAIILIGARQVGKTTLVKKILTDFDGKSIYFNADEPDVRMILSNPTSTELKRVIGSNKIIAIDEAQRIENIGLTSKLIIDQIPDVQLILTGSSAMELTNNFNEPLTGRKFEFKIFPFSFDELAKHTSQLEETRLLESRMIYGYYPEIVNNPGDEQERLISLISSYLYKDILSLGIIKKPELIQKLTLALALQIGSEVSLNELSRTLGADKNTISNYIDLLEKSYVIFSLRSFSRNLRNEIKKSRKIYFWDNGIRNSVINNFNSLELRTDTGALWENYFISERMKYLNNTRQNKNIYFWRTFQQSEIDYIEESAGNLDLFEIKWNEKAKVKSPKEFLNTYPNSKFNIINKMNFMKYLVG
jgi:predicted AAA+ superfamily ATPase